MKPLEFEFDFLIPQSVMFQSVVTINVTVKVLAIGGVIDFMPVVQITGLICMDSCFRFVENNFELYKALDVAAMDEYKKLHCNAKPLTLSVVELAEYDIINIHPSFKHLN